MGGYSPAQLAKFAVMILALVALIYLGSNAFGVPIPSWFIQFVLGVLAICFVAFVLFLAIQFVSKTGP